MIRNRAVCIDASALADLLVDRPRGQAVAEVLGGVDSVYAPDLINAEVLNILRRVERVPTTLMVEAVWRLRHNVSPRDACYVITARAFDVPLLTADLRLARAPKL